MKTVFKEEGHPFAPLPTLLAKIEGSIDSQQYLSLYVQVREGDQVTHKDVIGNGRFACAYYVSSLLTLVGLTEGHVHTTVTETINDMLASGWYEIDAPIPGAVILWAPKMASDSIPHRHIGFSLGGERVVSTDGTTGKPTLHHVTYGLNEGRPVRVIEKILFHKSLR
jgi:hypothetical protein